LKDIDYLGIPIDRSDGVCVKSHDFIKMEGAFHGMKGRKKLIGMIIVIRKIMQYDNF